jgi:hypothetical protein
MSVDRDNSGNLIIIPNEQGEISHPYQTTFHDPLAAHNEANTITRSVPLHKMHQQSIFCPSDVDENHWDAVKFRHTGKERDSAYAELFAIVLGDLKRRAEVFLGKNVSEATIVVPNRECHRQNHESHVVLLITCRYPPRSFVHTPDCGHFGTTRHP